MQLPTHVVPKTCRAKININLIVENSQLLFVTIEVLAQKLKRHKLQKLAKLMYCTGAYTSVSAAAGTAWHILFEPNKASNPEYVTSQDWSHGTRLQHCFRE